MPFIPVISETGARRIETRYGMKSRLQRLTTEKNGTFLVNCDDGKPYLAKISNPHEQEADISLKIDAIEHVGAADESLPVPRIERTSDGDLWFDHLDDHGQVRKVHLRTFVDGSLMESTPLTSAQLEKSGTVAGRIHLALKGLTHPREGRVLPCDIKQLPKIAYLVGEVEQPHRDAVKASIDDLHLGIEAELSTCRRFHNVLTGSNVLVTSRTWISLRDRTAPAVAWSRRACAPVFSSLPGPRSYPRRTRRTACAKLGGAWARLNYFPSRSTEQLDGSFL